MPAPTGMRFSTWMAAPRVQPVRKRNARAARKARLSSDAVKRGVPPQVSVSVSASVKLIVSHSVTGCMSISIK